MAADVNLLTTKADCDQALTSLTKEKGTYAHRDYNQTYADTQATDRATTVAAQLAKATDDVAHYTTEAARTGLTEGEKRAAQRALIAATARKANLELSNSAVSGPTAYLADVDADQIDAQIATLDASIKAVEDRKAALPS
ncbi:hypothetical protein GCM10028824_00890 [Hymenobacter segetis]|uniref:Uncharacterized protein n=1 Tax=Hymenobacter segetis TaxID=2025509 RepID=A0ABU9LRZ7_9BACT